MTQAPIQAQSIPEQQTKTIYPKPFAAQVEGRIKRKLGDYFGLTNFGINHTELLPGYVTALMHSHSKQDEFIYVLEGHPTVVLEDREYTLNPGDCYGVKAGSGIACQVVNKSDMRTVILEIGDRTPGDEPDYPNDDLKAVMLPDGKWQMMHKDGSPY